MTHIFAFIYAVVCGLLYALGFDSYLSTPIFPCALLSVFLFFYRFHPYAVGFKKFALYFFIFSLTTTLSSFLWISNAVLNFTDFSPWVSYLCVVGFSFIALPSILLGAIFIFLFNNKMLSLSLKYSPSFLAGLMILGESLAPHLFPSSVGHSWLPLAPHLPFAPWGGALFYSFISYWLVFTLIWSLKNKKIPWRQLPVFIAIALASFFFPLTPQYDSQQPPLKVRLVQSNIGYVGSLSGKYGTWYAKKFIFEKYGQLSLRPGIQSRDLVVWPETAYSYDLRSPEVDFAPSILHDFMQNIDTHLLMGTFVYQKKSHPELKYFENESNSVALVTPEGKILKQYAKKLLMPFGETVPAGGLKPHLYRLFPDLNFFYQGKEWIHFQLNSYHRFITPICYEILWPSFLRKYINAHSMPPQFMINVTNDYWYDRGPQQWLHLNMARWRSLETGLPIIRATNTGISTILYPDGKNDKILPYGVEGIIDSDVPVIKDNPTPFIKWGYFPLFLALLFFLLVDTLGRKFQLKPSLRRS